MAGIAAVLTDIVAKKPSTVQQMVPYLKRAAASNSATPNEAAALVDFCMPLLDGPHLFAMKLLRSLLQYGTQGFPTLHCPTVVCQAVFRIFDPATLAQCNTETCGPAAFVIDLCRNRPHDYTRVLIDLVMCGRSKLGDLDLCPDEKIRNRPLESLKVAQVDWIMLASIRDSLTGMNIYGVVKHLWKDIEDFGILPSGLFEWLRLSGYETIALIGEEGLTDALRGHCVFRTHGSPPAEISSLPISPEGACQLAELGSGWGCSVFLFVDDKLSDALNKGTSDFELRHMFQSGSAERTGVLAQDRASQQSGRTSLSGKAKGGHVMLVAEVKIGFYVSITAFNRGKLVYHHTLPKQPFFSCVRSCIIATDRRL